VCSPCLRSANCVALPISQQEFAAVIDVPLNTFRMWDSGLRPAPPHLLERATIAALEHARDTELVPLDNLARECRVHQRTLRAAARTGRCRAERGRCAASVSP